VQQSSEQQAPLPGSVAPVGVAVMPAATRPVAIARLPNNFVNMEKLTF
jgi:hypothetical protein